MWTQRHQWNTNTAFSIKSPANHCEHFKCVFDGNIWSQMSLLFPWQRFLRKAHWREDLLLLWLYLVFSVPSRAALLHWVMGRLLHWLGLGQRSVDEPLLDPRNVSLAMSVLQILLINTDTAVASSASLYLCIIWVFFPISTLSSLWEVFNFSFLQHG